MWIQAEKIWILENRLEWPRDRWKLQMLDALGTSEKGIIREKPFQKEHILYVYLFKQDSYFRGINTESSVQIHEYTSMFSNN